jgi:hypothetical protein
MVTTPFEKSGPLSLGDSLISPALRNEGLKSAYGPRASDSRVLAAYTVPGQSTDISIGAPRVSLANFEVPQPRIGTTASAGSDLNGGQAPHIKVRMQEANENLATTRPTAIIQTDGAVQTLKDGRPQTVIDKDGTVLDMGFLTTVPKSDVTIEVQRDGSQAVPNHKQQEVLNLLTDKFAQTIESNYAKNLQTIQTTDGQTIPQVTIEDPAHLVSNEVEQKYGNGIPEQNIAKHIPAEAEQSYSNPGPEISPQSVAQAGRVNRAFQPRSSGEMPASEAERYYPPRTVAPGEGDDTHYLNMLAALAHRPVDSARHVLHGYKFGLYDTGSRTFADWFLGFLPPDILEKLGHPPDLSKLAEVLKDDPGLLAELQKSLKEKGAPQELRDRLATPGSAEKFADFAGKLTTGEGDIKAPEMNEMMPESLQSRMALDTIKGYRSNGANPSPSDIALAYQLDKKPGELSRADRESAEAKEIARASSRLYSLSRAKQGAQEGDRIAWTPGNIDPDSIAFKIIKEAKRHENGDPTGCATAHAETMERLFHFRPHGDAWTMFQQTAAKLTSTGKFELVRIDGKTDKTSFHPGDIFGVPWADWVVRQWHGRNCGHVGEIGTNGTQIAQSTFTISDLYRGRYRTDQMYVVRAINTPRNEGTSS